MNLRSRFSRELPSLGLPAPTGLLPPVTDADLSPLPEPAQRYLRFMDVVGRPRDGSFCLSFAGRFKTGLRATWRPCEVWQYDTSPEITRTFFMRIRFGGLPVLGRDTYRDGRGRMVGELFDLFTVLDGSGPELDVSELVTYLNDIVLIAPSMLLVPAVAWAAVDVRAFDVALTDREHVVRARVFVDDRGAPVDFETTDRFLADPANGKRLMRARWTTPIEGWQEVGGRRVPTRARAVWHLADGEFSYAEFDVVRESVAFNARPPIPARTRRLLAPPPPAPRRPGL